MSSPRIVRLEKSRLLILPGQTVNGCGAVWPSEFFTTLLTAIHLINLEFFMKLNTID